MEGFKLGVGISKETEDLGEGHSRGRTLL